jgi:hypothetical protein
VTGAFADAADLLPSASLRELAAAHRAAAAARSLEERLAYEAEQAERTRAEARGELLAERAAARWAMWCASVPARYVDDRADPGRYEWRPFGWWLSRLDAAQFPERVEAWLASRSVTLVLSGPVGSGKTTAAVAAGYAAAGQAVHVRLTSQLDYLARLRPGGSDDPGRVREQAEQASLLILDDFGAETEGGTEFVRREMCALLDGRLNAGRRTILTLNGSAEALADAFGDRIMSRVRADAVVLKIAGEDRRRAARAPW